MVNIKELEKGYEISYNPLEGFSYLYLQRKNDSSNVDDYLPIFETISLSKAITVAKENHAFIRDGVSTELEDSEARKACDELNALIS